MSNSVDVTTTRLITQVVGAALKSLKDIIQEAEHLSQIMQEKKVLNSLNEKLKAENAFMIEVDKDENHKKLTEALKANNVPFAYFSNDGPTMQLVVAESDYEAVKNYVDAYLNNENIDKISEIHLQTQEEQKLVFTFTDTQASIFERKADIYNIDFKRNQLANGNVEIITDNSKEAKDLAHYSCHISQGIEGKIQEINIKNNNEVKLGINNIIENKDNEKQYFVNANNPSSYIEATNHSYKIFENNKLLEVHSLSENKEQAKQLLYDLTKTYEFGKCIAMSPEQFINKDSLLSDKQKEFTLSPSEEKQKLNEESFRKIFECNENTVKQKISSENFTSPDFSFQKLNVCTLDSRCIEAGVFLDNLSSDEKKQLSEYCQDLQESTLSLESNIDIRTIVNETITEDIETNTKNIIGKEDAYEENVRRSSSSEEISY